MHPSPPIIYLFFFRMQSISNALLKKTYVHNIYIYVYNISTQLFLNAENVFISRNDFRICFGIILCLIKSFLSKCLTALCSHFNEFYLLAKLVIFHVVHF